MKYNCIAEGFTLGRHGEDDKQKYIHLQDVVIHQSGSSVPFITSLWRGKLSAVDGFSLGLCPHNTNDVNDQPSQS